MKFRELSLQGWSPELLRILFEEGDCLFTRRELLRVGGKVRPHQEVVIPKPRLSSLVLPLRSTEGQDLGTQGSP